jgi:hypothetical protein
MSTNLSVTKSVLAKLLAGENLNVVHDASLKTAMFNTKTRTLYLPVFEVMDGELYDLLVGHEDGHALYTPHDGWHGAIEESKRDRAFKDALNIIEDARIEKLIKRKYPGLARSFSRAYRGLTDRDFFGVKRLKDYNKLNILDRINLYFKCGSFMIMPFSDDERSLVQEISNAETWEQVVDLAKRAYGLAKKDKEDRIENMQDLNKELLEKYVFDDSDDDEDDSDDDDSDDDQRETRGDDESEEDDSESDGDSDDDSDDDADSSSSDSDDESDDESEDDSASGDSDDESEEDDDSSSKADDDGENDSDADEDDDSLESVTDRTFREREKELIAGGTEVLTLTFPEANLDNIILPARLITDRFQEKLVTGGIVKDNVDKFNSTNNRYINMLIKEFEMRKNASQFARTTVAKTGELDMNKLHQYKYSSDLFRKISVVAKGKNHGIILFLDMSGSMAGIFGPTVEQTLTLATFCKRVGIPFDVYGFTNTSALPYSLAFQGKLPQSFNHESKFNTFGESEKYSLSDSSFHLMHLLGSDFSPRQYRASFGMMCTLAYNYYRYGRDRYNTTEHIDWNPLGFGLGSTPFIHTLVASRTIIENFKKKSGVDITNVVYMTDGDGSSGFTFYGDHRSLAATARRVFMVDRKTKLRIEIPNYGATSQQEVVTKFIKELTDCKHIGFYLCPKKSYGRALKAFMLDLPPDAAQAIKRQSDRNDFFAFPRIGYDTYFHMSGHNANIEDEDYAISDGMSTKKITKIFAEAQQGKHRNRALVAKFAQEIAG